MIFGLKLAPERQDDAIRARHGGRTPHRGTAVARGKLP